MSSPRRGLWGLALCVGLLWLGGLLLWSWDAAVVLDAAPPIQLLRRSLLVSHGLLAWLLCLLAGAALWPHVRHQWHHSLRHRWPRAPCRAQTWLGLGSAGLLGALVLSGAGLLYAPGPWHAWLEDLHHWAGLVLALPLLPHLLRRAGRAAPDRSRAGCRRGC